MDGRKDLNVLVGANIKREREKAGFTQDQFSELLGIGSKSLSSIERGVVGVSLTTLLKICEILHISANVLLYEKSRKNDVDSIALRLEQLSAEQFEIASNVMTNLIQAFSLEK
ncbi:MAG: helix-turn-helix transcriptional regulator [Oscillospiraceae bacterium]|nr:helix-turn-helix transcriptional regulator [Oscillospiraceae bacterium]